jgi:molybdate transport system ATP-binding protein
MNLELSLQFDRGVFSLSGGFSLNGDIFGLAGSNGSGKSTLLHLVAGLLKPDRGRIILNGRSLCDTETGHWTPPERRKVGLVFQEGRLFPHLTVGENLAYSPEARKGPFFDELVGALSLRPYLKTSPGRLSGGERQRVALGRALLAGPELLLLDEPFAAQDRTARTRLVGCLKEIRNLWGVPMLLVSHNERDLLELTEGIICMSGGRIIAGEPVL